MALGSRPARPTDSRTSSRARCAVFFSGRLGQDAGIPAPAELLHGGHVDRPVVEPVLDVGEMGGQEAAVGPDRVAAQRHRALGSGRGPSGTRGSDVRPPRGSAWRPRWRRAARIGCACRGPRGSMAPSSSGPACTTRSGPSATTARSSSVTRVAISTMTWRAGSSPVISRSIHTSTRGMLSAAPEHGLGRVSGAARARPIGSCGARGAPRPARPRSARAFVRAPRRCRGRSLCPRRRRARAGRRAGARAHRRRAGASRPGYAGFVQPRSGLALRHGVTCLNTRASSTPGTATSCASCS